MGWSLNLYGVKKETKEQIPFLSIGRSSDLYAAFDENCSLHYPSENCDTNIDSNLMSNVIKSLTSEIDKATERLREYEKYAASNPEYVEVILEQREYLEDLKDARSKACLIDMMVDDVKFKCSGFEAIKANIG
jgi:hypothetical protein